MPSAQESTHTIGWYKEIGALIILLVSGFFYLVWCYLPAIRLAWRCLSLEERFPLWITLRACGGCLWPLKPSNFRKQVRLWLELRILHPKPRQEPGWYFDPATKRYRLEFDEVSYRRKLAVWKRTIRGRLAALKIDGTEPLIEVKDVFRLNDEDVKNCIKQYLLAVADLDLSLDEEASFLCDVKVNEGFLLPLNLLAGLMSRFADDWDPIISAYGDLATSGFSTRQMSLFTLWLLWGPSVPICTCDQWSGPVTFQYGFGDENNSVRVRVRDQVKESLIGEFNRIVTTRHSLAYPALHASVTGKLWPPSSFVQGDICGAQHELLNPDREAFILEYKSHTLIGSPSGSSLFYTAYVWAMFVVGHDTKPTMDQIKIAPWLHIMPFFEHGNIVDEATYGNAKRQLVHKVLSFVKESAREKDRPALKLWYVGAIDEPGCGHESAVVQKGKQIRKLLQEAMGESENAQLEERVILDDHSFRDLLSGCYLSRMIGQLLDNIEADNRRERKAPVSEEDIAEGSEM